VWVICMACMDSMVMRMADVVGKPILGSLGFGLLQPFVSGMDAPREPLRIGDSVQHRRQQAALLCADGREECILVLPCHLSNALQDLPSVVGEVQRVQPPSSGFARRSTRFRFSSLSRMATSRLDGSAAGPIAPAG